MSTALPLLQPLKIASQKMRDYMDQSSTGARRPARRPSRYSLALARRICERLAAGETLSQICEDGSMPSYAVLRRWEDQEPGFLVMTLRARQSGNDHLAEECLRIADDPKLNSAEKRVRIDTRMKSSGELAQLTADTDLARAQIEVDKAEATSSSLFVAGGRPFVIWVCGAAMANDFMVRPFALFVSSLFKLAAVWPALDVASLMPLMLGLLGLGAMRSFDKSQASTGLKA